MSNAKQEKWILYSTCDEDSNSEMRALDIQAGEDVLSVTGSGCRTLSLISKDPRSVISVDYAPGQSYLLELKLAAMRHFSYDTLLAFLGVDAAPNRAALFAELEPKLSRPASEYFKRHSGAITKGILFSGRHEQFYVRVVAPAMRLLYGKALRSLFQATSLEEQRRIYRERIDGPLWRWLVRTGFSESTIRLVLNDDSYKITIDVDSVGGYVLERLNHTFTNHLAKDNHWVAFMFNGGYPDRNTLPHFLLRENYEAIRAAKTDVQIVTANLIEYIKGLPPCSLDKFSLSDVTSCVDSHQFATLMEQIVRTARPGGRICYRNFLAKYRIAPELASVLLRDDSLCSELDHDDLAFVYNFEVSTVAT